MSTRPPIPPGIVGHHRAHVTAHYAVLPPAGIMDSLLPGLSGCILRFMTSPRMGARFAQALLLVAPGGGTDKPLADGLEHFLYVLSGRLTVSLADRQEVLGPGAFVYVPQTAAFAFRNPDAAEARALWIKRPYQALPGIAPPPARFGHRDAAPREDVDGRWRYWLLGTGDLSMDFEMNIMGFGPGTHFHCVETHIMEHGLYMLRGQGLQLLGRDWHEIWEGDFVWMGPYVPQQFYATGWGPAEYLLYKDVNRDVTF
ncbi:MAG: (S)-ureidoglycine aminohydrolase [Rhodovarius sp.]|nr:(S)-ureidoglycine aminohydrolase [Rhodovarius sp.]MDW8313939.1 (S)-ureidoglycine aminohydrolase [Rhodovarius sp.]